MTRSRSNQTNTTTKTKTTTKTTINNNSIINMTDEHDDYYDDCCNSSDDNDDVGNDEEESAFLGSSTPHDDNNSNSNRNSNSNSNSNDNNRYYNGNNNTSDNDTDALLLPRYNSSHNSNGRINGSNSSSTNSSSSPTKNNKNNKGIVGIIGIVLEFLQNLIACILRLIPALFKGLFKKRRQKLSKNNNKGHNNDKKSITSTSRTATKIKDILCMFFLLILGIRTMFFLCFESQPQLDYRNIPTSSSASSSSSSLSVGVVTETEIENHIENQTQNTQSRQQYNNNNKPTTTTTTTTTTIYTLPSSSSSSSNDLEHQLLNHYERDLDWYQNKCLLDNATSYINNMRNSGSISMKHYTRGCSTSGLHPVTHYNPFQTPTHNCEITTSIDIIRTTTTIDHLYESDESWTMQTYDKQKNLKQIGGDTFYIVYYEEEEEYYDWWDNVTSSYKPVAVSSKPIDYYNGTYGIENFYTVPFQVASKVVKGATKRSTKKQYGHPHGRIVVYPLSTCFIGELYPPLKDEWNTGGSTGNIRWSSSSTSTTSTSTSTSTTDESTPIEGTIDESTTSNASESTSTSESTNNVDNNVGIVKRPSKIIDPISSSNLNDLPNLKQYNRTIFFGDSIMRQMVYNVFTKQYYHQNPNNSQLKEESDSRIWMGGGHNNNAATANTTTTPKSKDPNNDNDDGPINVNMPLSSQTLPEYIKVMEASIQDGLLLPHTTNTTTTTSPEEEENNDYKIALVIGSSAWDIIWPTEWQGPTFQNHLQAVTDLLFYIRLTYPHIYILWKLPYSNAMYNADPVDCFSRLNNNNTIDNENGSSSCISALRYSSQERFYSVYQKQKQLLTAEDTTHNFSNDSHISVIDLYDISYFSGIHWMIPNDSIHYLPDWNRQILQLLYR